MAGEYLLTQEVISNHDIEPVGPEYYDFSTRSVKMKYIFS